jgi:hypothetical protein
MTLQTKTKQSKNKNKNKTESKQNENKNKTESKQNENKNKNKHQFSIISFEQGRKQAHASFFQVVKFGDDIFIEMFSQDNVHSKYLEPDFI